MVSAFIRFRRGGAAIFSVAIATLAVAVSYAGAQAATLSMISTAGAKMVDPAGKPVILKGCNLGNYLMLESWMFGGCLQVNGENFKDQSVLFAKMTDRFGAEKVSHLMEVYRDAYIQPRDFDLIKSFGFNLVRLPFDYRQLQDDASPNVIRPDAFRRIDHLLDLAEAANVYVVLDMHGVPGGQSVQDHTGTADQNRLWQNTADQDRTVALWKAVAEHCKNRSVVAAYDLINEPYGNFHDDVCPGLAAIMPRLAEAIRSTGDKHVVFFPGALNGGIAFYGDPHAQKMENIGFTEHYYPGLFGSKSAMETHARLLGAGLPAKEAYVEHVGSPYFVGEFNVVLQSENPNRLMRAYYDRFAEYGWPSAMWSYKLLTPEGGAGPSAWYMVTNADPLPKLEVTTCDYSAVEKFFADLGTGKIAVNEPLRNELTRPAPQPLPLAKYAPPPAVAPAGPQSDPAGFTSADIGGAKPGHTVAKANGRVEVLGGGADINATHDSFRFVSRPGADSGELQVTITSIADTDVYAKAGVMARWGDGAGAPMAMLNIFPDGSIALMGREKADGPTKETHIGVSGSLPIQLRLQVANGKAIASYRNDRGAWRNVGSIAVPNIADFRTGLAVCAHADEVFNTVVATIGAAGDADLPAAAGEKSVAAASLLANGSFEKEGAAADTAADWNRWGDWMNRETGWSPTHDGQCVIGYHHWQITGSGGSAGLWQEVKVKAGERYAFTVFVQHDKAAADQHGAKTLELRLESATPGGQVTLNTQDFPIDGLATGKDWSRLTLNGTAISDTLRVLAVINSSAESARGGAVKLDDASLTVANDGK